METKRKPIVFKDFADLHKVRNQFNKPYSLESVTNEMSGKEETSNASGKEGVDALYNIYLQLVKELDTITVNIQDTELALEDKKNILANANPAKEGYPEKVKDVDDYTKKLSALKQQQNSKKSQVITAKADYMKEKASYEAIKAEEAKVDVKAYETQKQLEAEAAAKAFEQQKAFELEQQKSAVLKSEKKAKFKKIAIYGGGALVVVIVGFIAYKKGWLKNIIK